MLLQKNIKICFGDQEKIMELIAGFFFYFLFFYFLSSSFFSFFNFQDILNNNKRYFARADGNYRANKWTIFWYGLKGFDLMQFYKEYSLSLDPTFHQINKSTFT